jgi:hypothetical protein
MSELPGSVPTFTSLPFSAEKLRNPSLTENLILNSNSPCPIAPSSQVFCR